MNAIGHRFTWITLLSLCFEDLFSCSLGVNLKYLVDQSLHLTLVCQGPLFSSWAVSFYNLTLRENSSHHIIQLSVNCALSLSENSLSVLQFEYIWKVDRGQCIILSGVSVKKRNEATVRHQGILSWQVSEKLVGQPWSGVPEDKHLSIFRLSGFHVLLI